MTVIDTSAVLAIIFEEESRPQFLKAIASASRPLVMSSVSLYETGTVLLMRLGPQAISELLAWLTVWNVKISDFNRTDAVAAIEAYRKYGKGIHPAGLNLGDCPAYALATAHQAALLFAGNDFSKTDVIPARS